MTDDLQKELNRISNLRQNKNKDTALLEKQARLNLWKKQINLDSRFSKANEKEIAEKTFDAYLENYEISSFNEMQNLSDLVYEEVLKQKIQKDIDTVMTDENSKFVPEKLIQSLHEVEERIWKLKEKIGINSDKSVDDLTALEELEEKFKVHIALNRNEYTLFAPYKCSDCGKEDIQALLLRRRVKNFDVLKHPAFAGRFLYNVEVIDDVKKELITKEQAARYLRTSPMMIQWIIENEHDIIKIEGVPQEVVNKEIDNTPYLRNSTEYTKKD